MFNLYFCNQGKLWGQSRSGGAPWLGGQADPEEEAAVTAGASQAVQVLFKLLCWSRFLFCLLYVHSGFASFHTSQPLILFRDSERRIFYRWPIFSKHKRRPFRRRRRKYPRKPGSRGSSEGDIYSSSNYYRQPQSSYQEEDYYQEAASSSRRQDQDSETESDGYRSWYAGDYQEEFANSYNYQPSQSDSYPSYQDSYTQHSEQYGAGSEPFNWESWDSKKFSR